MSKERFLIDEVKRKKASSTRGKDREKADQLFASLFPAQQAFITDPSKRKAALCARRTGKSYVVLTAALITALTKPGAEILILVRTRGQAKRIYWRALKRLCAEYNIQAQFKNMDLELHFDNGSLVCLSGADTSEEVDKYRGSHFDVVVIDEGKSYSKRLLDELIEDIIKPALSDDRGTLMMIGTPGAVDEGYFWAVVTKQTDYKLYGDEKSRAFHAYDYDPKVERSVYHWSVHRWEQKDNVKKPHIWEESLQEKADNKWPDDDPHWLREKRGIWINDPSCLVSQYNKAKVDGRCDWVPQGGEHGLPEGHEWRYILGIDLGWHDNTAFVVAAWSPTHRALHFVYADRRPYMLTHEVIAEVQRLEQYFGGFDARVIDPAAGGKRMAEDLSQVHGLYIESASKQEKLTFIALMNADLSAGKIKLDPHSLLAEELSRAQWNADKSDFDGVSLDDCFHAAIYVWRYAQHHWSHEKTIGAAEGTPEYTREQLRQERQQYAKQREALLKRDPWQRHQNALNQLPSAARRLPGWRN